MDFSKRHAVPRRQLAGIATVALLHGALVYGLMSGLAKRNVEVVRVPVETMVIEEISKPPPPLQAAPPPPPPAPKPPPARLAPRPELPVPVAAPVLPTITVAPPPSSADVAMTPVTPPPLPAAPASIAAAPVSAAIACANYSTKMGEAVFPREARREGIDKGDALVQFTLSAGGEIRDLKVLRASHPIFARNSLRIVSQYQCAGQGRDVIVQVPFGYKVE